MSRPVGCIKQRAKYKDSYTLYYRGKCMGTYDTLEEAEKQRASLKEIRDPVDLTYYLPKFYDRLNIAIGKKGLSITDICKQARINRSSLDHYKNGQVPSVKTLISLALVLNVSTDWLLGLRE